MDIRRVTSDKRTKVRCVALSAMMLMSTTNISALNMRGRVVDSKTGETLIGAYVYVKGVDRGCSSGMDGTYSLSNLKRGEYKVTCSYLGYAKMEQRIHIDKDGDDVNLDFALQPSDTMLREVEAVGRLGGMSDRSARYIERIAPSTVNVVSAKAIEISPDLTVANVIQRVSGVSVERNSSGDGQYAILRGMDKRYNYTLVNGIKIPSPDNKNRYIPLDIFPSDMLDRLDVTKALTPSMEGDAVGGVVNMVMKDAPSHFLLNANFAIGYSQMYLDRAFRSFSWQDINSKTPFELHGDDSGYKAGMSEFTMNNLDVKRSCFVPNVNASLTVGNRFLDRKLGVMVSGSFQHSYRGSDDTFFTTGAPRNAEIGVIGAMKTRFYTEEQYRMGALVKFDYQLSKHHRLEWSNVGVNLKNIQLRNEQSYDFSKGYDEANLTGSESFRMKYTSQTILNTALSGRHSIVKGFNMDWTVSYAYAQNRQPDNTLINMSRSTVNYQLQPQYITFGNSPSITRRWEHNEDKDFSAYLNLEYRINKSKHNSIYAKAGGLCRKKDRDNFYNEYSFNNALGTSNVLEYGKDFTKFSEMQLRVYNPQGSASNPLTYGASEKMAAGYAEIDATLGALQVIAGVRMENTVQGYSVRYQSPIVSLRIPDGDADYTDILPGINMKYRLTKNQNLRLSYFRSVNRPGYYELVPYTVVNEDYTEKGNPDLKRALIDNVDFRYEFFPSSTDQILVGIFYKHIKDPIEYALQRPEGSSTPDLFYMPGNFGTANNYGVEIDLIKYFRNFGVKANYTYTHSSITTSKTAWVDGNQVKVDQKRPLYGQSDHVANLSLLYRDTDKGWNAQLAFSYNGDRIASVSQFLNNDIWLKGVIQGDLSIEKTFKNGLSVYAKVNNLFDSKKKQYIKGVNRQNLSIPLQGSDSETVINEARYGQTYLAGVRFKL